MTHSPGPMKGIAYMIASVFLLSISDAAAKWLAPHYPAIQIVCVRALLGVGLALCLLLWGEGRRGLATAHLVAHASRSLLMLGS
jgi:drug/metabolite transporter (DMT)-like permease